ncbi:MAG: HAMP domain-containing sensor histidine kinase, partial [Candidatus Thermoplasmatota archaeon]|nr:HAMP domain-containing sensor histidine kinase [Candidatus Thermoplasmatota archaeon]
FFEKEIGTEIKRLLQKGHIKMETYFKRKNESMFPVSIVGSTFIDQDSLEECMILIVDDITKQKTTERELKISQLLLLSLIQRLEKKVKKRTEKIEQVLTQKNEFIYQLGHDLKNPLGPLINLIPILLKNESDQHKREMLEVISRNTNHMKNLIINIIKLAQLNSGSIKLHFEPINIKKSCDDSINRNQYAITEKNITVKNYLNEPLNVQADKARIEELFDNIISNAIKYSSSDETISITCSSTQTTISISIKDTGIGMNKEQLSHVFDEFYKADESRHDFRSTGLGMSICKKIIESHNGHINIYSEGLGKGTTVTFTLQKASIIEQGDKPEQEQDHKANHGDE